MGRTVDSAAARTPGVVLNLVEERLPDFGGEVAVLVAIGGNGKGGQHKMVGAEAEGNMAERVQGAQHEPSADEKHDGERDLRDQQRGAGAVLAAVGGTGYGRR